MSSFLKNGGFHRSYKKIQKVFIAFYKDSVSLGSKFSMVSICKFSYAREDQSKLTVGGRDYVASQILLGHPDFT